MRYPLHRENPDTKETGHRAPPFHNLHGWLLSSLLVGITLFVGPIQTTNSGVKWPDDGSRYLNNGAMVHDWIASGFPSPMEFAGENYIRYPAFSVPYHPPGYAVLLGIWFFVFGLSYIAARWFVGTCLLVAAWYFRESLRLYAGRESSAFLGAVLFVTSPEISLWSQSGMSEIPSICFLMVGTYLFLRWVELEQSRYCWLAFVFAGVAFYCRIISAGVLPAWILWIVIQRNWRLVFSPHLIAAASLYVANGVVWSKFASQFAKHEVRPISTEGPLTYLFNLLTWSEYLPIMAGWTAIVLAILGIVMSLRNVTKKVNYGLFWLLWLLCYSIFLVAINLHFETRFIIYAAPAVFGLATIGITWLENVFENQRIILWLIFGIAIVSNAVTAAMIPPGVHGHDVVATYMANLKEPGNILVCTWSDSDFIFHYRCRAKGNRQLIRGDRTLAIRIGKYSGVDAEIIAKNQNDVVDLVKRGRIRYVLTSSSRRPSDDRPAEMILAHQVASNGESFKLIEQFELHHDMPRTPPYLASQVYVWEYLGDLEAGPSELSVEVPTANMSLNSE